MFASIFKFGHALSQLGHCLKKKVQAGKKNDFQVSDEGVIFCGNRLCVPKIKELKKEILDEAHSSPYSVHLGSTKMYKDLRLHFWWPKMKYEVAKYVQKCLTYQQVKIEHQRPSGKFKPLFIPEWKWEHVTMDFVIGLPRTQKKFNAIWVIVDRITKSTHFLPIQNTFSMDQYAQLYIEEIIRLGSPVSIISDRDPKFNSTF